MTQTPWSHGKGRHVQKRIVIEGDLVLQTPLHLGNGDGDAFIDMPLLRDPLTGVPLLPGTSIAGAMRAYLRGLQDGEHAATALMGVERAVSDGAQSQLVVEDALSKAAEVEIREGVKIDPVTRTADDKKLFNLELWQAGMRFCLRFELLLCEGADHEMLKRSLVSALRGFTDGSIALGKRKRRGYGQVTVSQWRAKTYDLTTVDGLLDWIRHGGEDLPATLAVDDVVQSLGVNNLLADDRPAFRMDATFNIPGSMLIRSGGGKDDTGPDTIHLHSRRANGLSVPIISGTSLAGALRARARKIVQTVGGHPAFVDELFGLTENASHIWVGESEITGAETGLVQNRVSIDRFTGGAMDTRLFGEQPAFGGTDTLTKLSLRVHNPTHGQIGLLLLLLKDLWTGDLPLGGQSSVGRGRLNGLRSDMAYAGQSWSIEGKTNHDGTETLVISDPAGLDAFVSAFHAEVRV